MNTKGNQDHARWLEKNQINEIVQNLKRVSMGIRKISDIKMSEILKPNQRALIIYSNQRCLVSTIWLERQVFASYLNKGPMSQVTFH